MSPEITVRFLMHFVLYTLVVSLTDLSTHQFRTQFLLSSYSFSITYLLVYGWHLWFVKYYVLRLENVILFSATSNHPRVDNIFYVSILSISILYRNFSSGQICLHVIIRYWQFLYIFCIYETNFLRNHENYWHVFFNYFSLKLVLNYISRGSVTPGSSERT